MRTWTGRFFGRIHPDLLGSSRIFARRPARRCPRPLTAYWHPVLLARPKGFDPSTPKAGETPARHWSADFSRVWRLAVHGWGVWIFG